MNTQSYSPTIKLNLPEGMWRNAQGEAKRIGISLQDFIRMLMATYFANARAIKAIARDQALYDQAQEEIIDGKFTTVVNEEELDDYLKKLAM